MDKYRTGVKFDSLIQNVFSWMNELILKLIKLRIKLSRWKYTFMKYLKAEICDCKMI